MKNKWKLGTYFGIGVYLHWSFLLLLGYVLLFGGGLIQALFLAMIFACVVAHEYGHVLTARHFGIGTRDITLYPIGGVAALKSMPKRPSEEIMVALAGPAVNVVIAFVLALFLIITGQFSANLNSFSGFLTSVMFLNVILAGFNLLPAFPMDGGRVLRAWLARKHDYATATDKAARVGQVFAAIFAVIAIFTVNAMFFLLAAFVYMAAGAERRQAFLERDAQTMGPRWQFSGSTFQFPSGRTTTPPPMPKRQSDREQVIDVEVIP